MCLRSTLPHGRTKVLSSHLSDQWLDLVQVQTARQMLTEAGAALLRLADGHSSVHEGWQNKVAIDCTHLQALVLQERARCTSRWTELPPSVLDFR